MQAHFEKMIVELQAAQEPFKRLEMLATSQTVDTALRVSCHVRWTIQRVAVGASYGSNRVQITARKSIERRINYEVGIFLDFDAHLPHDKQHAAWHQLQCEQNGVETFLCHFLHECDLLLGEPCFHRSAHF